MTVAELIERLKAYDGNLPVVGEEYDDEVPIAHVIAGGTLGGNPPDRIILRCES
jgi:hypothetical protein